MLHNYLQVTKHKCKRKMNKYFSHFSLKNTINHNFRTTSNSEKETNHCGLGRCAYNYESCSRQIQILTKEHSEEVM